jgi:hypothetical protein
MALSARRLIEKAIAESAWHMDTLRAVRDLGLPDWAIGAGFVRNAVWDRLHDYAHATPLADIDVLYFDPADTAAEREAALEAKLAEARPGRPWSVRNQARMHARNGDRPYESTEDALAFWLETPTAVALRLEPDDRLTVLAPCGLADLIAMVARPTAQGRARYDAYIARMRAKNWPATWPQVAVEGLSQGPA